MVLVEFIYNFARWYYWRLNDYIHYGDPRIGLDCDAIITGLQLPAAQDDFDFNRVDWDIPVDVDFRISNCIPTWFVSCRDLQLLHTR